LIFDTDILIWYMRKHAGAAAFVSKVPVAERNLSAISWLELLYGCRNRRELGEARQLITEAFAQVLPLTESIGASARQLMEQFVLSRRPGSNDVLIAATALGRGEALATANRKHFDFIPGLEVKVFRP
jgi:predicted nucleic acid-binding protein